MKTNRKRYPSDGFTLIELLVVVAVIGILASVILIGLAGFRGRGRDARRIGDLRQVQNGLELYFNAKSAYPPNGTWTDLTSALKGANIGINQVPNDPSGTTNYGYCMSGNRYVLSAQLEEQNSALTDPGTLPCTPTPGCDETAKQYCTTI